MWHIAMTPPRRPLATFRARCRQPQCPGSARSSARSPLVPHTPRPGLPAPADWASPSPSISRAGPAQRPAGTPPYPSRRLTAGLPGRVRRSGPLRGARREAAPDPGAPGGRSEGLGGRGGPAGEQRQQQGGQQLPHGGGRALRGRVERHGDFPGAAPEPGRASAAASLRHRSPPTAARAGGGGAPSCGTSLLLVSRRAGPDGSGRELPAGGGAAVLGSLSAGAARPAGPRRPAGAAAGRRRRRPALPLRARAAPAERGTRGRGRAAPSPPPRACRGVSCLEESGRGFEGRRARRG